MGIDLDRIVAIDVHTHAERSAHGDEDEVALEYLEAAKRYFGGDAARPSTQEVADYYRERNMAAIVFTVDDEAGMGRRRVPNEEVAEVARRNADVLIPFASIDPHK